MTVDITVDSTTAVPVYEQLRSQIAGAILAGRLADGARLPSARDLAATHGIAVNTVIRAYGELSRAGLISSRRRFGTVVTAPTGAAVAQDVQAAAVRLVMRAAAAGLSADQIVDLVRGATAAMAASQPAG